MSETTVKGIALDIVIGETRTATYFSGGSGSSKLTDLRTFLAGRNYLKSSDMFMSKNGSAIDLRDESHFTLENIAEHGKEESASWMITIERESATEKTYKTPDAPEYGDEPDTDPIDKKLLPTDDHTKGIMPRDTTTSGPQDNWETMEDSRKHVYKITSLFRGFLPVAKGIWHAPKAAVKLKVKGEEPESTFFDETYKEYHSVTYSSWEHEVDKRVANSASVSASGWGVSAKAEGSHTSQSHYVKSETYMYLYSDYIDRKVRLTLEPKKIELVIDLKNAMEAFIEGGDFSTWVALVKEWGTYVQTEMTVGGKLYLKDARKLSASVDQTSVENKFKAAASGAFASFSASASVSHSDKTDTSMVTVDQGRKIQLGAFGGQSNLVHNPSAWLASLGPSIDWRNCKTTKMIPIYSLASVEAQIAIRNLMVGRIHQWEKEFYIDYYAYMQPMNDVAADVFE